VRKPELIDRDVIYEGPLAEAVRRVYAGEMTNGLAVAGLLAVVGARTSGYARLREFDV
jgi:hypothetical protein